VNAITQLDLLHLEETVSRYDIGELVRYWPAPGSAQNNSYFLRTLRDGREREYLLRIIEHASSAGGPYVALLEHCADAGLPVAPVVRNRDGSVYDVLDGNAVLLTPRLPGRHVYNPTVKQVQALARFTGRLHMAGAELRMPPFPRGPQWLAERFAAIDFEVGFTRSDLLSDTVGRVTSMLERTDVRELPTGVIHGDLFRDNVLFNERGLTGVLDFYNAADGYLVYDLAVAANDWCSDANGILDPERTVALLREYHQLRPLNRQELWFFSGFTLYAALVFWLSRLSFTQQPSEAADIRFCNPEELQRIVEQHSAHFFYLDERMLV
jgi:homoserine kinase type II